MSRKTHGFAGGDLEDLGGETDGSLNTELLVLGPVDEVGRDCEKMSSRDRSRDLILTLLQVLDVAAGQSDSDFMDFGSRHRCTCGIVFLFSFGDVTHCECRNESDGDCIVDKVSMIPDIFAVYAPKRLS